MAHDYPETSHPYEGLSQRPIVQRAPNQVNSSKDDMGSAFGFPFKDPHWVKKILMIGIVLLIPILGVVIFVAWPRQSLPDPVKEFEILAKSFDGKKRAECYRGQDNKWSFFQIEVTSVAYDVTKTDSLISPLTGKITIEQHSWYNNGDDGKEFSSADEARLDVPKRYSRDKSSDLKVAGNYAWHDGLWVFQSVEAVKLDRPTMKSMRVAIDAKDLKDPSFDRGVFSGIVGWPFMDLPVHDNVKIMEPLDLE